MGNEDGSIQVVFNGEIYNHLELRTWLEGRGHQFRNHCDTEVLVHLYEELGADLVNRLRGMFAFAIYDTRQRTLLLARDRLGLKPLYYSRRDGKMLFASEPKAILADPELPHRVCPRALEDYLCFGMVIAPRSIFDGIEQLRPGHTLQVSPGQFNASPRRYWAPSYQFEDRSVDEWARLVRDKLEESVKGHLMSDVPLGAFLSGGVDSASVVGMMARHGPVNTFTIGFQERDVSEVALASLTAQRAGTNHVEEIIRPDAAAILDDVMNHFDEPLADTSVLPTYLVCQLAARSVKVVLSGDGADEPFAGYPRYAHDAREARLRQRLPRLFRRSILGPIGWMWPQADWLPRPLRLRQTMQNIAADPATACAFSLAYCRQPMRRRLLSPTVVAQLRGHDPKDAVRAGFRQFPGPSALGGMISADLNVLLPDDYLVKVDRAGMAHGLEIRPPFLDHELVELACRIPPELKLHNGESKAILKRAVADLVPAENLRQPKRGFNVPIDKWLRGPLHDQFMDEVLRPNGPVGGMINLNLARKLFDSHQAGSGRYGQCLWSLLVLSHWAKRYLPETSSEESVIATSSPPSPIRVGFVVHVMQVAGAEVLIEETIRRLGRAIEPTIFCLDAVGTIGERLQAAGVPVVVLGRKKGRDLRLAGRMAKEIADRRVQVVHAHQYTPFFYAALAKACSGGAFRLIQTEHGRHYPDIVSPMRRAVNRVALDGLADAINACCEFSGKALSRIDGFTGNRVEVIDNGVELSRYDPTVDPLEAKRRLGWPVDRRTVVCVARFHPVKDHAMLVRGFALVAKRHADVDLMLAGEGERRPMLEALASELGVTDRIKFLGVRRDVPALLAAADLFALTSVSEAASLTLMEAMASARPSVVTNVGGNPELIRDGLDGLLVPRGDHVACANAMEQLLADPKRAKEMGLNARRRAEERFNLETTVQKYFDLYQRLAK